MLNENSVERKTGEDESEEDIVGVEIDEATESKMKMAEEDDLFLIFRLPFYFYASNKHFFSIKYGLITYK